MALGILVLAARLLGPKEFGVFGAVLGASLFVTNFADFGLSAWATRRMAAHADQEIDTLNVVSSTAAVASTILFTLTLAVSALVLPDLLLVVALLQLATSSGLIANLLSAAFVARERPRIVVGLNIVEKAVVLGSLGTLALTSGLTIEAIALCYATGAGLRAVLTAIAVGRAAGWRPKAMRPIQILKALGESWPFGLTQTMYSLGGRLDVVVLAVSSATLAGTYSASMRFLEGSFLLTQSLTYALLPIAVKARTRGREDFRQVVLSGIATAAGISLPVVLVYAFLSKPLIDLVYGDEFADSARILILLGLCIPFAFFNTVCSSLLNSVGEERKVYRIASLGQFFRLGGMFLLPRIIGNDGPAIAVLSGTVVAFLAYSHTLLKTLRSDRFGPTVREPAIAGGADSLVA